MIQSHRQAIETSAEGSASKASSYSLSSSSIAWSPDLRLDAAHYNPKLLETLNVLKDSGMRVERLVDVTDSVFIPPRFRRVYVEDQIHGVPFLQGSHVVQFQAADVKYLSSSHHRLEKWIVHKDWILVTCSGTIGRTVMCPQEWDGWAASQHILRILPDEEKCPSGYLCSFLASPLGSVQLTANIYGAVVDELTENHVENVLVPLPETEADRDLVQSLDLAIRESLAKRENASHLVTNAIAGISDSSPETARESNGFSVRARYLYEDEMRFDAGYFNPGLLRVLNLLEGAETVRLGEIADVRLPNRFKRIYVDREYGLPFLQGSHIVQFRAMGLKYISREHTDLGALLLEEGWLLVTRSGTVGRVAICPSEWDGWAGSEHIIRIVPKDERCPAGYLCSFLSSPLG